MNEIIDFLTNIIRPVVQDAVKDALSEEGKSVPKYGTFLTPNEMSELTKYTVQTIYQMNSKKQLPGAVKFGGKLLFKTDEVLSWMDNGRVGYYDGCKKQ